MTKEELNCQESDEEIERLPNISTLLRASEFIDLGMINDQATVQATSVTATVQATVQAEDSADDLPTAQYLRKFMQKDVPQQDLVEHIPQQETETQQQEFPQQKDVMETE